MKANRLYVFVVTTFLAGVAWASGHDHPSAAPQTFTGEIMDTICAGYKGHAHMMREMKSMGTDKASCIQKCLQLGGKYVLYDATNGVVYVIANPEKARAFGGQDVQITGTLDKKKLTISDIKSLAAGDAISGSR